MSAGGEAFEPADSLVRRLGALGGQVLSDLTFDRRRTVPHTSYGHNLALAMEWLRKTHHATGQRGSAKSFSYLRGWRDAYPETTGYIAPTFFDYAARTGEASWRVEAVRMLDFLCDVQQPDGGVLGGTLQRTRSKVSVIFNTGMVLAGWRRGAVETGEGRYLEAATRAADFLADVRSDPERWRAHSYQGIPHAYHARVAWHLLETSRLTEDERHRDAALDVFEWVLQQQMSNGFFRNCTFKPSRPTCNTHGLAYALRGLIEGYRLTGDERMLRAVRWASEPVRTLFLRTGRLPGFFGEDWTPRRGGECLTGVAQLALVWFKLGALGGGEGERDAAIRAVDRLCSLQSTSSALVGVRGAIKGSHPVWGGYAPFQYPNWATKFFADALLLRLGEAAPSRGNGTDAASAGGAAGEDAAEATGAPGRGPRQPHGARDTTPPQAHSPLRGVRGFLQTPRVKNVARRLDRSWSLRARARRLHAVFDRRRLTLERFRGLQGELGVVPGATVMVHCSMDEIGRRVPGLDALGLCRLLEELVGPSGTLLVPTFPFRGRQLSYVHSAPAAFDPRRTPSRMGLLTEIFRRLPGTVRSLHPTHSVAARGPRAQELCGEHHLGTAFGRHSPFYRMREGGTVVGLGVDVRRGFTVLHVAEELEPRSFAHVFTDERVPMTVRDGDVELRYDLQPMRPVRRNAVWLQRRLQQAGAFRSLRENGLLLCSTDVRSFIDLHLEVLRNEFSGYYGR